MSKTFLLLIPLLYLFGCSTPKENIENNQKKNYNLKSNTTPNIYSCELVELEFYNKIGKPTGIKEYYLRCSVQDYFIKLCESKVSKKDLKPYLNKGIQAKIEIREGLWDDCDKNNNIEVQSRTGEYIIIESIIK